MTCIHTARIDYYSGILHTPPSAASAASSSNDACDEPTDESSAFRGGPLYIDWLENEGGIDSFIFKRKRITYLYSPYQYSCPLVHLYAPYPGSGKLTHEPLSQNMPCWQGGLHPPPLCCFLVERRRIDFLCPLRRRVMRPFLAIVYLVVRYSRTGGRRALALARFTHSP